jgi:hypothetical protein
MFKENLKYTKGYAKNRQSTDKDEDKLTVGPMGILL